MFHIKTPKTNFHVTFMLQRKIYIKYSYANMFIVFLQISRSNGYVAVIYNPCLLIQPQDNQNKMRQVYP